MNKKIIWGIIAILIIVIAVVLLNKKPTDSTEVINSGLVSMYPALANDIYLKSSSRPVNLETEAIVCESQKVIEYSFRPLKDTSSVGGDWRKVVVVDCGSTYYVNDNSDSGSKLFGPFDSIGTGIVKPASGWKTYTNTDNIFSFSYPNEWEINKAFTTTSSVNFIGSGDIFFALSIGKITDVRGKIVTLEKNLEDYGYNINYNREDKVINGYPWLQFISKTSSNNSSIRFVTTKNDVRYEFIMNVERPMTNADLELANKIVSSFKFTN